MRVDRRTRHVVAAVGVLVVAVAIAGLVFVDRSGGGATSPAGLSRCTAYATGERAWVVVEGPDVEDTCLDDLRALSPPGVEWTTDSDAMTSPGKAIICEVHYVYVRMTVNDIGFYGLGGQVCAALVEAGAVEM